MEPETNSIKEFNEEEITNILREALTIKLKEKRKLPEKDRLIQALIDTNAEFMSCFKILGFDLDGNPINILAYKEKIQRAALDNMFMDEIGRFVQKKQSEQ